MNSQNTFVHLEPIPERICFSPVRGSLVILNPNEMHRIQSLDSTPYERIVISLKREYIQFLSSDDCSLENCFFSHPLGSGNLRVLSENDLQKFLALYEGLSCASSPDYFGRTVIESHLDKPLCLSALAKEFHVSEGYLSSQFKYHTGLTLRTYLLDRKIHLAKHLLQTGSTVTDACFASGFNDYSNFIRSFKKVTGVSPGKFR